MADAVVTKVEAVAVSKYAKAVAWLKVHWYSFAIGAGVAFVVFKVIL